MLRHILLVSFFLMVNLLSYGQEAPDEMFADVPGDLLRQTQLNGYPDVPFYYVFKDLDISFEEGDGSIIAVMKYHVRAKIFDASAGDVSLVSIPYYFENNIETVSGIRAVTSKPDGRHVALDPGNIRTININARYNVNEFTMPAIEDGDVIDYSYTIRRRYIEELPDFYLANRVPTAEASLSITYPKYLRYKAVPQNYDARLVHAISRIDSSSAPKIFTYPQPTPIIEETWTARSIAPVPNVAYSRTIDDYRAKIRLQLSEFGIPRQTLENSWDYIVAEIRRKQQPLREIDRNEVAHGIGADIRGAVSSLEAAQDSIFRYLNSRANYSGNPAPFSSVRDSTVLEGTPSDQAAINQTLIAMLRGAGIEAHPALISTRGSGQINRDFPSFFSFSGQLAYSSINGRSYMMDAGFPFSEPGLIPIASYNEWALILKPDSFQWLDVAPEKSRFAISVAIDAELRPDGTLEGHVEAENGGYPAQRIRSESASGQSASNIVRGALFDGYTQAALEGATVSDVASYEQPVHMAADFTLPDYAVSFSDGLEFRPMVVGFLAENPFEAEQRNIPVMLDAPEVLDLRYTIQLPPGYAAEDLPVSQIYTLPGGAIEEDYAVEGQTLTYRFQITLSEKEFAPAVYPRLYQLYERWVQLSTNRWLIRR